jgi:L-cysteate sulfo-lyase
MLQNISKLTLGFWPTPLTKLERLSAKFNGPEIYIKRDDQSGLAMGGNKVRKLEYLMAKARAKGADTIVTAGAQQSNHCRQTAGACSMLGLECHLMLGGEAPPTASGNLLLNQLMGAHIHWCGEYRKGELIPTLMEELKAKGKKPYLIPYGGSDRVGALGFVNAVKELCDQTTSMDLYFDRIVFASSSGGTHAGLMCGKELYAQNWQVQGISIDKQELPGSSFEQSILDLANEAAADIGLNKAFIPADVILNKDYLGDGYGVLSSSDRRAIRLLAQLEGILLDPVYSGRALGGLIDMIERGIISSEEKVLFWHTGGVPALFGLEVASLIGNLDFGLDKI